MSEHEFKFDGRACLIAGAGRGIGRAVCVHLAKLGCRIVAVARTRIELDEVVRDVSDAGGSAVGVVADLRQPSEVERVVEDAATHLGCLDIFINVAGSTSRTPFEKLSWQEVLDVFAANMGPMFLCSRAATTLMAAQGGGKIVNILSTAAHRPYRNQTALLLRQARTAGPRTMHGAGTGRRWRHRAGAQPRWCRHKHGSTGG